MAEEFVKTGLRDGNPNSLTTPLELAKLNLIRTFFEVRRRGGENK